MPVSITYAYLQHTIKATDFGIAPCKQGHSMYRQMAALLLGDLL